MKFKFTLMLLVSVVLIYTACKKLSSKPSNPALTPKQVSSQLALNIAQTLYGGFGTLNLKNGLSSQSVLSVTHRNKLSLNDVGADPFCGVVEDTTLNMDLSTDSSQVTVTGPIKYTFMCDNGILAGYNFKDSLQVSESTPTLSISYNLGENLTLLSTDATNVASTFSLTGPVNESVVIQSKTGSKQTGNATFNYVFQSLIISPNVGTITSGTATFSTSGSGPGGDWNYTGTITFIPDYRAQVVINGATYIVDLLSGQIVPSA